MSYRRRGLHLAIAAGILLGSTWTVAAPAHAEEACARGKTSYVPQRPDAFAQIGISQAWTLSHGDGVLVAVVDSGVEARNDHLAAVVQPGVDLVGTGDGRTDTVGHGTAVAAIIAAQEVPGSGLVGVAPGVRIVPVRVYEQTDPSKPNAPNVAKTAQGIVRAVDLGARIIAVPQSGETDTAALSDAVRYADAHGALVVASAGNAESGQAQNAVRYPANYPQVLSVTAVDATGTATDASEHGVHVKVAAPGQNVLTAYFAEGDCVFAAQSTSTSYATGYVAGVAALAAAMHPEEKPADWQYRILVTALRATATLRDSSVGWGIVAPYAALNFVNDGSAAGPPNPRFATARERVDPVMVPPEGVPDESGPVRAAVAGIALVMGVLVVAGLLAVRIRAGRTKPVVREPARTR
ncbi:MAG: S8 family serine peptidase [Propionibacteriaceae bacterium]|nr:S8 family serine peptidase [Micropruina sp.]